MSACISSPWQSPTVDSSDLADVMFINKSAFDTVSADSDHTVVSVEVCIAELSSDGSM